MQRFRRQLQVHHLLQQTILGATRGDQKIEKTHFDDRPTDRRSVVVVVVLLFYLAPGKAPFNNFDAIFWVPFLQVHFYTRLERERERIEYKYKDYLHTTEYECRRRRRKHEPAFGTVSSRPLFVLRLLLDVLNDDD